MLSLSTALIPLLLALQGSGASTGTEQIEDFRGLVGAPRSAAGFGDLRFERVTTGVPWPRGLVFADGQLIALARGRHRIAGGVDPSIADRSGALFVVDTSASEPLIRGEAAGRAVRNNVSVLAEPDGGLFSLYDPAQGPPVSDSRMDRPYCTLAFDPESRNLFICGYSGVDLPRGVFRKNATDSIHRYDLRDRRWHAVEQHDPRSVALDELGQVVPNTTYPHHDVRSNPAPHGLLNGPDSAEVVGRVLYAAGKDNHLLASYALDAIRQSPDATAPEGEIVFKDEVDVRIAGVVRPVPALGPSALASDGDFLYVGFRTSSFILRFPVEADGRLKMPLIGELIAVFEPWDQATGRSANLIDLAFNSSGELFASCASEGRIWNLGIPDPDSVFDGVDTGAHPTSNRPFVDLAAVTGNPRARCGNIVFDDQDRLYLCSGNYDSGTPIAGVIYRVSRTGNPGPQ